MEESLKTLQDETARKTLLDSLSACLSVAPDPHDSPASLEARVLAHAGLGTDTLADVFGSFSALLDRWFTDRLAETVNQTHELEEPSGSSTFGERIEALTFILLDSLEPYPGVDRALFHRHAAPLQSAFRQDLLKALAPVTTSRDVPSVNRIVVDTSVSRWLLAETIIRLLEESLADVSANRSRSAALADRSLALASAVATDPVAQRVTDLIRYAWEANYFVVPRVPFFGDERKPASATDDTPSDD